MSEKNLAANIQPTAEAEVVVVNEPQQGEKPAILTGQTALGPVGGISKIYSINPGDIDVPWLNVIQKNSDIPGDIGDIVFDRRLTIAKANTPTRVIPLEPRKGWKENHAFESKEPSRFAWTLEEKEEIDRTSPVGTIECAELILLIPAPLPKEGELVDEAVYMFPFAGHNYALGRLYVQKLGYRHTFKRINTFNLVNGVSGARHTERVWTLETALEEGGSYKYFYPRLTVTPEATDKGLLEFLLTLG